MSSCALLALSGYLHKGPVTRKAFLRHGVIMEACKLSLCTSEYFIDTLTTFVPAESARLYHVVPLQWRHNERASVSNHQLLDCFLNHLFGRRSKKTSKFRATGLCEGNSPVTGEFPAQMASTAENVSIWWRRHAIIVFYGSSIFRTQPGR